MVAIKQPILSALDRGNEKLNSFSDGFSEQIEIPVLKSSYKGSGALLARISACFSNRLEMRVKNLWEDPFSTKTFLTLFKPVENLSLWMTKHKPTQKPFLHFLDQSFISIGQHLYAYMKEVNHLFQLPISLKAFIKRISFDNYMIQLAQSKGRVFVFLNSALLKAKKVALALVDYVIRIADLFFQCVFASPQFEVFGYLREILHNAREKIHGRFTELAIRAIENRESRIRKIVVGNVADFTTHYIVTLINRVAIKTGLGVVAYAFLEKGVESLLPGHSLALRTITGATTAYLLWRDVYQPYFDEYYQAFKPKFDPDKCNMRTFLARYYLSYLSMPIDKVNTFLKGVK